LKLCYLLFLILFVQQGFSQSRSFVHYSVDEGLNSSTVYCVEQDRKGFLWFGTDGGVSRFDGKTFEQFTMADGLSDNEVFRIFEDHTGRIWFFTFNGYISYYENNRFYNHQHDPDLLKIFTGSIYTDVLEHDHTIFMVSSNSMLVTIKNKQIKQIKIEEPSSYGACQMTISPDNTLLLFTGRATYIYSENGMKKIKSHLFSEPRFLNSNTRTRQYSYFYHEDGIYRNGHGNIRKVIPSTAFKKPTIFSIMSIRETSGDLWVGQWSDGICRFTFSDGEYKKADHYLPGKSIHSVYTDKDGNLWFTTDGEGVYQLRKYLAETINYTKDNGLISEPVYVIRKDRAGKIWLGSNNAVLSRIDSGRIQNFNITIDSVNALRVMDIAFDGENGIICGTANRIYYSGPEMSFSELDIYQKLTKTITKQAPVKNFARNSKGNYSVALPSGIYQIEHAGDIKQMFCSTILNDKDIYIRAYSHYYDRAGTLWVSTIKGLARVISKSYQYIYDESNLLKGRFLQITETADSTLILASAGTGVLFLKKGKVVNRLNSGNGLISDICRRVYIQNDTLWIATNRGLCRAIYSNNAIKSVRNYTTGDGLLSNDVKDVLIDHNKIYAATEKGLSIINAAGDHESGRIPTCFIHRVSFMDSVAYDLKKISLPYDNSFIKIHFIAPYFGDPADVIYEYRLNDQLPAFTTGNLVEFSNLSPGNYIFQVRARKNLNAWSNTSTLHISILPPLWQTTWFLVLAATLFTAGISLLIRYYYLRQLEKARIRSEQEHLLTNERLRIASDMHDDFGSCISEIAILSDVLKKEGKFSESSFRHIDKISQSARELIEKMSEIIWALNSSNDTLENLLSYIKEYIHDFTDTHNLKAIIDFPVPYPALSVNARIRRNIFLVIKEALNNTLKHSDADSIFISAIVDAKQLRFILHDNGKPSHSILPGGGHGIKNMNRRIAEIRGEFQSDPENTHKEIRFSVPISEKQLPS
jgi:signal transduction histidine kinase/ligand-binding sensor domain-containing protein